MKLKLKNVVVCKVCRALENVYVFKEYRVVPLVSTQQPQKQQHDNHEDMYVCL